MVSIISESLSGIVERGVWPIFSRLQREPQKVQNALYTATALTALVAFPAFLGIFALGPENVPVAFGEMWMPSIPVMQALAFIGLIHSLFYFNEAVMFGLGKPFWRLGLHSLIAFGNVIGFLIAIHWGIVAVAISYVVVGYLFTPVALWMVHILIEINIQTYLRKCLAPAVGYLVMVIVIFALKQLLRDSLSVILQLIIYFLSGTAAYALTVHVTFPSLTSQLVNFIYSTRKAETDR